MEPKAKQRESAIKAEGVVNGPLRACVTVSLEEGKGGRTRSPPVPESEMARSATQRAWLPPLGALLLLLLFARRAAAALEDGLVNNGAFETVPAGGASGSGLGEGVASLPGWTINGTVELVESGQKQGGMILIVPEGVHAVRLGNDAEISQELQLEKGSTYAVTFSAARTCAQLESLNVSVWPATQTVDLQTLYSVEGWDAYAWAFQAQAEDGAVSKLSFKNPGMEDDPTCGPIIDNIAIKKLFTPDRPEDNAVVNGDFEEGPWMFPNASLGVLLPTNLDEETSALSGWMVESNRAVRYVDSYHFDVPQGKRAIELLSGKEGIISQMVETTPEKQYNLTFTVGAAGDSCQTPLAVMAFAGDQAQNFHYSPTGNATHQPANITFTARAERTRIAFYSVYYNTRSDDRSSLCGPVVDEVRVWGISGSPAVKSSWIASLLGLVVAVIMVVA
ncbi:protein BIIDXI-like isoform X1 [Musa acuminata AAA Group]|uniref:protein BIIDXI-like isoform X1 n=2 Tax=Musa acuminata AAA Group TaxID=214697 RepID=UPI0031CE0BB6